VTYKFDGFHGRALYELNGLPGDVRNGALLSRLVELLENPWDAVPESPGQSVARLAFFGAESQGILTILVFEETENAPGHRHTVGRLTRPAVHFDEVADGGRRYPAPHR
jgi:hypothetical protein